MQSTLYLPYISKVKHVCFFLSAGYIQHTYNSNGLLLLLLLLLLRMNVIATL